MGRHLKFIFSRKKIKQKGAGHSTSSLKEREVHLAREVVRQESCSSSSQPVSHGGNTGAGEMSQQLRAYTDSDSILSTREGRLITACNSSYLGPTGAIAHIHIPTHRHRVRYFKCNYLMIKVD